MKKILFFTTLTIIIGLLSFFFYKFYFNTNPTVTFPDIFPAIDKNNSGDDTFGGDFPFYIKESFWGPCPTNEPGECEEKITIYTGGKVIVNEVETSATNEEIMKLSNTINATGILNKECPHDIVLDYWATYWFTSKKVIYPGCEKELEKIDVVVEEIIK
mgnify:CR=1 FL=1